MLRRIRMRRVLWMNLAAVVILLLVYVAGDAQATHVGPPPVGQALAREGDLAVELVFNLALGTTDKEVEAEGILAAVGIIPRNGWVADYPVTPDIVGEVRDSIITAANGGKISKGRDEALKALNDAVAYLNISIQPYNAGDPVADKPAGAENYPNPAMINSYFSEQGPPVITYYAPPPAYYYMYSWVPYPFWWVDFWFPGYYILYDFHRVVIDDDHGHHHGHDGDDHGHNHGHDGNHRKVSVVSNHFNDTNNHKVYRIDPVERFKGHTFAGIGAEGKKGFIPTGQPKSQERIFNRPDSRRWPDHSGMRSEAISGGARRQQPSGQPRPAGEPVNTGGGAKQGGSGVKQGGGGTGQPSRNQSVPSGNRDGGARSVR
jgi:hypothetical protein